MRKFVTPSEIPRLDQFWPDGTVLRVADVAHENKELIEAVEAWFGLEKAPELDSVLMRLRARNGAVHEWSDFYLVRGGTILGIVTRTAASISYLYTSISQRGKGLATRAVAAVIDDTFRTKEDDVVRFVRPFSTLGRPVVDKFGATVTRDQWRAGRDAHADRFRVPFSAVVRYRAESSAEDVFAIDAALAEEEALQQWLRRHAKKRDFAERHLRATVDAAVRK